MEIYEGKKINKKIGGIKFLRQKCACHIQEKARKPACLECLEKGQSSGNSTRFKARRAVFYQLFWFFHFKRVVIILALLNSLDD